MNYRMTCPGALAMRRLLPAALCLAAASMLTLGSCSPDDLHGVDLEAYRPADTTQMTRSGSFTVTEILDGTLDERMHDMHVPTGELLDEYYEENVATAGGGDGDAGDVTRATSAGIAAWFKELMGGVIYSDLREVSGTYRSIDHHHDSLTISGKIIYPRSGRIKNIILASHYTVTDNAGAPTGGFPAEGIMAAAGYAVVMSDYIGYGVTQHMEHPYLINWCSAHNEGDMLAPAREWLRQEGRAPESDSVFVLGYSQGAASTMALLKLLELKYWGEVPVKRAYVGGGPYSLTYTYHQMIEDDKLKIPSVLPYIVRGMIIGEDLTSVSLSDFLVPEVVSHYDEWYNSKKYSTGIISQLLPSYRVSEFCLPRISDMTDAKTLQIYMGLLRNSIDMNGWVPYTPIYLFHSMEDDVVPFVNASYARQAFKNANITYNLGNYGGHNNAGIKFLFTVKKLLE